MLDPLTRPPLTEAVLEKVKELITSGKIAVGDRMPGELQLVSMLGISRSTVREVLITLQAEGYIEIKRGKGAFVLDKKEFDRRRFIEWFQQNEFKIQELIEVRMAIEPMAAFLAATRITTGDLQRLEKTYQEFTDSIKRKKVEEIVKGDELFHEIILKSSGNSLLFFIYSNIMPVLKEYRSRAFSPPANSDLAIEAHDKILLALTNRNAHAASEAMLAHIEASRTDVLGTANAIYSTFSLNRET